MILGHFVAFSSKSAAFLRNRPAFFETGSEASLRPWLRLGLRPKASLLMPSASLRFGKSFAFEAFGRLRFAQLRPFRPLLTLSTLENTRFARFSRSGEHNAPLIRFAHEPPLAAVAVASRLARLACLRCASLAPKHVMLASASLLALRLPRSHYYVFLVRSGLGLCALAPAQDPRSRERG